MTQTHWKKLRGTSEYLGSWSLEPGKDLIATIDRVGTESVVGEDGKKSDCVVAHFKEKNILPMILNATNLKTIQKIYKTPYVEEWSGRAIQLYIAQVKAFGDVVDALRIRPIVPKVNKVSLVCADCGKTIQPYKKMTAEQFSMYTQEHFGKALCYECGMKATEAVKEAQKKDADDITDALKEETTEG